MGMGTRDREARISRIDAMQKEIESLRSALAKRPEGADTLVKVTLVLSATQFLVALAQLLA
jgi:hypothetical protein